MSAREPPDEVLRARGLTRTLGEGSARRDVLRDLDFRVARGEVVLVLGASGSGKSTLLALLGTLDTRFEGELMVLGRRVRDLSDRELSDLRARRIGFVFQSFHLLPHLDVTENVAIPHLFGALGGDRRTALDRAREVLQLVGLGDRARSSPSALSGGQRQRVALARALFGRPELLLADEPTGNLDRDTGERIVDLLAQAREELGATLVIVTHEERLARIASRRVLLREGRLFEKAREGAA